MNRFVGTAILLGGLAAFGCGGGDEGDGCPGKCAPPLDAAGDTVPPPMGNFACLSGLTLTAPTQDTSTFGLTLNDQALSTPVEGASVMTCARDDIAR